jgi:hypothetical protein
MAARRALYNRTNLAKIEKAVDTRSRGALNKDELRRLKDVLSESDTVYTKVIALYDPILNKFFEITQVVADPGAGIRLQSSFTGYGRGRIPPIQKLDPPVGDLLHGQPVSSAQFGNLGSQGESGVAAGIFTDDLFSVSFDGALLPTVFRVGFKNLTTQTDRFTIDVSSLPAEFETAQGVASILLQPGEIGEISLCLRPTANIPPGGTIVRFDVTVASTNDPTVVRIVTEDFAVPAIAAATFSLNAAGGSTTPGVPLDATLEITSVGNVAANITFDIQAPPDLAVTGFDPVTIDPGRVVVQAVTLTQSRRCLDSRSRTRSPSR